jgi:predicted dehydrogenase
MKKLKLVQFGVTHEHAPGKIATLKKLTDIFEIVGVVDDRASTAARYPQLVNMQPYEGLNLISEADFFAMDDLDLVVVETANADLTPTALKILEKNLPMHMDKPGGDAALFDKLSLEYEKRQLPFQMGYMLRGNPVFQFCKRCIKNGLLGDIFEIQCDMHHHYGGEEYAHYMATQPGGIMFNLCCHLLDFIVGVMGKPENIFSSLKSTPEAPDGALNNCMAVLEYAHATATVRACCKDFSSGRRLRIAGTKGVIEMCPTEKFSEPMDITLTLSENSGDFPAGLHRLQFPLFRDRYATQFQELAAIIRGEKPNVDIYAHDRMVNHIILACSQLEKWDPSRKY